MTTQSRSEPGNRLQIGFERPGFSIDLDVAWDERVAVLFGPSGSGKSTLFEVALGLLPQARARIRLADVWLENRELGIRTDVAERALGWVPQDPTLFPHLSVADNIGFAKRRADCSDTAAVARAIEILEIERLLERHVRDLSGGERQRVAIASALASQPRVLLLDEPLASLDLALRARVLPYLLRLRDELEIPILYITHDPDEAIIVGDVVIVLDAGRVVATGPPREVLWSRAVLPLSEALGLENAIDARVIGGAAMANQVETDSGLRLTIPEFLPAGERVRLGLRAQDVLLARERPGRISARNAIAVRVVACEVRADGVAHVHLDAGQPLVAKLTADAVETLELRSGVEAYAIFKAQALRRLPSGQPDSAPTRRAPNP